MPEIRVEDARPLLVRAAMALELLVLSGRTSQLADEMQAQINQTLKDIQAALVAAL